MPGSPAFMRNVGESRWPIIVGVAMFGDGDGDGGVWLVVCWRCWEISGCVLLWWSLACSRRSLMASVGVGRLLNLICVDELGAMFWQHHVILVAPDPHGGPLRVIMRLTLVTRICDTGYLFALWIT